MAKGQALIDQKTSNIANRCRSSPRAQKGIRNRYNDEKKAFNYGLDWNPGDSFSHPPTGMRRTSISTAHFPCAMNTQTGPVQGQWLMHPTTPTDTIHRTKPIHATNAVRPCGGPVCPTYRPPSATGFFAAPPVGCAKSKYPRSPQTGGDNPQGS